MPTRITVPAAAAALALAAWAGYRAGRRRCTDENGCASSVASWGCGR